MSAARHPSAPSNVETLRVPPHSIPAEHGLIGAVLVDPGAMGRIDGLVIADDFYRREHRVIFAAAVSIHEAGGELDVVTISERLEREGMLDDCGGLPYLLQVAKDTPTAANAEGYARIVRDHSRRRRYLAALHDAASSGDDKSVDLADQLCALQSRLDLLLQDQAEGKDISFREVLRQGVETVERNFQARHAGKTVGVPTGLPTIDRQTGGLQPPRLVVVAARPSIGKTALVNQIALHATSQGYPVGMCSLEMGLDEIAIRAMANRYQCRGTSLMFGDEDELAKAMRGMSSNSIADLPYWIDDSTYTLPGIVSRITAWKRQHNIQLAIVDHIGLVEVESAYSANDRLGKVSRTLKKLAKRLGIAVIAVSQLNRNVEREKRKPVLADLRDSGNVEQDADIVWFLHADADAETGPDIPIHMGLLKNRSGIRGWLGGHFSFTGSTQTFRERTNDHDDDEW